MSSLAIDRWSGGVRLELKDEKDSEDPENSRAIEGTIMIRVGVIGYGYWGPNIVRNFMDVPGATVVAVSDVRSERLDHLRVRYPSIKTTTDARELIFNPQID